MQGWGRGGQLQGQKLAVLRLSRGGGACEEVGGGIGAGRVSVGMGLTATVQLKKEVIHPGRILYAPPSPHFWPKGIF